MNTYLENTYVRRLSWTDITVSVRDRRSKQTRDILKNVSGHVDPGQMLALMGPSGCGKTTLLNVLAHRQSSNAQLHPTSQIHINGRRLATSSTIHAISRLVEADDVLIGALTVKETLSFAARLDPSSGDTADERQCRINEMLQAFGLTIQANTIVGTLVKKGISTGQKRRLSVASQLLSAPKILFLDEPTSGLDSAASHRVMSYIKDVTKMHNLIVVCSIHQPSSQTFSLFDSLLLLSGGQTCYFGSVPNVKPYFDGLGYNMPTFVNPAEFLLTLTNTDFERDDEAALSNGAAIHNAWRASVTTEKPSLVVDDLHLLPSSAATETFSSSWAERKSVASATLTVLHRSWIKSRRDVMVYGVRLCMYMGLAILLGTVWLRLPPTQRSIQAYTNCIFFGSAFMSFMAVVYVPAFIEDRQVFIKDRANGLYGSTAFVLSNFLVGLPYLFGIAAASSAFVYWMVNFRPDGGAFMTWILWMYLNLLAAESLVVLVSCLVPNFVGALALTAMVNGLCMACNDFMVAPPALNAFYRYVFYYIDYQAYVFGGLVVNEFGWRDYACGDGCRCDYDTALAAECLVAGPGVLAAYGFSTARRGEYVGIMLAIIAAMRLMGWAAMQWRR